MADVRGTHTDGHGLVTIHFEFGGHAGGYFVRKISRGRMQCQEDAVCKKALSEYRKSQFPVAILDIAAMLARDIWKEMRL